MDDKTVIARPKASKPAETKVEAATASDVEQPKEKPGAAAAPQRRTSSVPIFALAAVAFVMIGLGSALTTIYILSPKAPVTPEFSAQELSSEIVAVEDEASEKEDEALIRAATQPRIIDLSGDPVIVRQLANAPRQLLKLEKDEQRKAAEDLGIKSALYRFKDVLDVPDTGLNAGIVGAQEDIAVFTPATADGESAKEQTEEGSSVIVAETDGSVPRIAEFAQVVKSKTKLASYLTGLGLDPGRSSEAEAAYASFYNRSSLDDGDRLAVRAVGEAGGGTPLEPMQISIYSNDELVGTIAVNDIGAFAKAEDPWYQRDIFETQMLPEEVRPEDQPRLLDAIYAAALRNRLPTPVVGEAIMMMSRTQDLEQKVQAGDTITFVYSPVARDAKTGFGRIVYISIGRTNGNLECIVVQSAAQFECASPSGETSVNEAGMVTPVNGVIVARFGPQGQSAEAAPDMNFGVEWTAPKGSPVLAAFDGAVTAVGPEDRFGTVIRLSHADGKTTMYGYLQRVQTGVTVGAAIRAGQVLGYVGTPATSREPRLYFELQRNGVPVDPVTEMQSTAAPGGAVDQFVSRIIHIESANRCTARNPLSTAVGLGQFIESTWMTTIRLHRPDLLQGRTRRQVLDLRLDCDLSRAMTTAFTRDNAAVLRRAGHTVTPGNLYLAHFLGVGGASRVLSSRPDRGVVEVFGAGHIRANPFLSGKTIGYLVSWAAKKMGGKPPKQNPAPAPQEVAKKDDEAAPAAPQASAEPLARYAGDPAFAKMKAAINTLLR